MAILYKANETDFSHFGLGPLNDAVSILVTEERNGIFELEMEYPVSGSLFAELKNDRLIKSDAGHNLKDQRFKIIRITKPLKGIVTVYAEHVSYLSQDLALKPNVRFSGSAQQALSTWKENLVDDNPFIVSSDITTTGNGTWTIDEVENPRRALGGVAGSILDVYGGEYRFDNYQIRLMRQRGVNSAALIAYGRNLIDLTQEEEIANTYTSIYPYSVYTDDDGNQQLVTLPEYYIDSEYVNNFARRKILSVDFSEEEITTVSALRSAANRYIVANNVGVPKVNLRIKYIDLAKTLDYKNQAVLEEVNLCDNVPVYFEKFDINTSAKVIKVVWDDLREQYDSVEIGEARSSLSQSINATVDGKLEKVEKQINNVQLQADGMKLIYRQEEEPPPGSHVGDLWYQPNGIYEIMYQWDGSIWKEVFNTQDLDKVQRDVDEALGGVQQAKDSAQSAVDTANQATQTAGNAITQAQSSFDLAQESLTLGQGLTSRMSDAEGNLSTLNQTTQSLAGRLTDAEGNVTTLTATVDGLQTQVTDIDGNVSNLTQISTAIQARLTDAEGNINELTLTSQSLQSTISSVRDDLDGIEIGGRNLILGSNRFDNWTKNTGVTATFETVEVEEWGAKDATRIQISGGSEIRKLHSNIGRDGINGISAGMSGVYSIWMKNIGSNDMRLRHNGFSPTGGSNYETIKVGDSRRVIIIGRVRDSHDWFQPMFYTMPGREDDELDFIVWRDQFEKGNKATDWSPAPEDMATQSQITQLSDNINLRVAKGDVINQINLDTSGVLISGKKLILDGDTAVTGTFRVANANITSVDAGKMTTGTLDAANVNIINLNASNINAGTIQGIDIYGATMTGTEIYQTSGSRELQLKQGRLDSYYQGDLAMSFGQYSLDFYNKVNEPIGSFGPIQNLSNPNLRGLGVVIENDFFSIGLPKNGVSHATYRTSVDEGRTVVAGPFTYNNGDDSSAVQIYANAYLHSSSESPTQSIDQPSIIMTQGRADNDMLQYFGGYNRRSDAVWQVRWRKSQTVSQLRIEANSRGVDLRGNVRAIDYLRVGTGTIRVYPYNNAVQWRWNSNNYIVQHDSGRVEFVSGGRTRHAFAVDGTKSGGSIEIDGENLGMSPIDSPQVLLSSLIADVKLYKGSRNVILLDDKFKKALANYTVFPNLNRHVVEIEKEKDHFIVTVDKDCTLDFMIYGERVEYEGTYWMDMST